VHVRSAAAAYRDELQSPPGERAGPVDERVFQVDEKQWHPPAPYKGTNNGRRWLHHQ
jgi:hypothetical protein